MSRFSGAAGLTRADPNQPGPTRPLLKNENRSSDESESRSRGEQNTTWRQHRVKMANFGGLGDESGHPDCMKQAEETLHPDLLVQIIQRS
jgi:hypothetical protein